MSTDRALAQLDRAQSALAECRTVMEAKQIADVAEAARVYLERTNASVETVHRAAEIRTLAERQMGDFLKVMPKNDGGRPIKTGAAPEPVCAPATLADIGITKKQSATVQKLADIPEPEFRERIAVAKASGDAPTAAKVLSHGLFVRRTFVMKEWQAEMRTKLEQGYNRVPKTLRAEAAEFLHGVTTRLTEIPT